VEAKHPPFILYRPLDNIAKRCRTTPSVYSNTFITFLSSRMSLAMIWNARLAEAGSETIFSSPVSISLLHLLEDRVFCDLLNIEMTVFVTEIFCGGAKAFLVLFVNQSGFPRTDDSRNQRNFFKSLPSRRVEVRGARVLLGTA